MKLQAVEDWIKSYPLEVGDTCIFLVTSNGKIVFKVEGSVINLAAALFELGCRTPDFGVALSIAACKLVAKGGEA